MNVLQHQWTRAAGAFSRIDLTFLFLRIISLFCGLAWLGIAPLSPAGRATLTLGLTAFSIYSAGCYLVFFLKPAWLRKIYFSALFLDLVFISYLIRAETSFDNSFFLGFYILVALHTIYFGLSFGLFVAALATICYIVSITPQVPDMAWMDLAIRIVFLYFMVIPLGVLSEKLKHDKKKVEGLNRQLAESLENLEKTQGKLIEAEKLSALGRITADIAHEIRNPLTAVGGFARRLAKTLPAASTEKKYTEVIINETSRLEKILVDTLIYGKPASFELQRQELNAVVSAAVAFHCEACMDQNIVISENLAPDLEAARIDPDQVQQALNCLISNSIDAMAKAGGALEIATSREIRHDTTYQVITVSDTGDGLADDILQYIFEPFFTTKRTGRGTGLGLSIVRKIIEDHRGTVEVRNNAGAGVCFTLSFPFQSATAEQMLPCWEFLNCGIKRDPTRRCPAYPYFGRTCWSTAGTFSPGTAGICAMKIADCRECAFYKLVRNGFPIHAESSQTVIGDYLLKNRAS